MKKKLIAMVLCAAMVLGMTACGSKDTAANGTADAAQEEGGESGKTVINFYEHSDSEKLAQALVEAYNASQDEVEVKLSIIANDDYDDKIKVMMAGNSDIDVFWLRSGGQARTMAADGALLPLDDLMAANGVDFSQYGSLGEAYKYDGKTYGMCTNLTSWLLWYNKDLFDEMGIDYPIDITWDEYADICKQFQDAGKQGGLAVNWIMNTGSAAAGEYLTDENLTRTREYVEFLNRIYNEDKSNMSIEEMAGSFDVNAIFAEGETAMMLNGSWEFLMLPDAEPQFTYAAAPLPHFEDVPVNETVGGTSAYVINAKSEKAEAAFDFLKFCNYSDEGAKVYASLASQAAYPSDAALEVYNQSVNTPGTEHLFAAKVRDEQGYEDYYGELNDAYKAEITEYLIGNCTIDEAFENFKVRREEIINK